MLFTGNYAQTKESGVDRDFALNLSVLKGVELHELFAMANRLREKLSGSNVDLCSIVSAKTGACPEDCSFCAQSAHSNTGVNVHPLLDKESILEAARSAKQFGARRFCIVTSGKKPSAAELKNICSYISVIRDMGLLPCATLGMLGKDELEQLKNAGLCRYHHNLESSEAFFSEICSTHTYKDKLKTIESAKLLGLSVCSGGIFGLGESWDDRIDMAFALKDIEADSVPINFFTPVNGTPLEGRGLLDPLEALKIIAIYRLVLPGQGIRVCGGRMMTLRDMNSYIFVAGADGLLIGNYLTTLGRKPEEDLQMIKDMGFEI